MAQFLKACAENFDEIAAGLQAGTLRKCSIGPDGGSSWYVRITAEEDDAEIQGIGFGGEIHCVDENAGPIEWTM